MKLTTIYKHMGKKKFTVSELARKTKKSTQSLWMDLNVGQFTKEGCIEKTCVLYQGVSQTTYRFKKEPK